MSSKLPQPETQVIKLHKNSNGMGLSIVAAKGAGQERLGIYIKSVVPGGAADADGRLQAGDQLLRVDGQSLIGITQERFEFHHLASTNLFNYNFFLKIIELLIIWFERVWS
jgi:afadin